MAQAGFVGCARMKELLRVPVLITLVIVTTALFLSLAKLFYRKVMRIQPPPFWRRIRIQTLRDLRDVAVSAVVWLGSFLVAGLIYAFILYMKWL